MLEVASAQQACEVDADRRVLRAARTEVESRHFEAQLVARRGARRARQLDDLSGSDVGSQNGSVTRCPAGRLGRETDSAAEAAAALYDAGEGSSWSTCHTVCPVKRNTV